MKAGKYVWTAVCRYEGKEDFVFYSPDFFIDNWADLESVAKYTVEKAWSRISPHPAPSIIEIKPGYPGLLDPHVIQ